MSYYLPHGCISLETTRDQTTDPCASITPAIYRWIEERACVRFGWPRYMLLVRNIPLITPLNCRWKLLTVSARVKELPPEICSGKQTTPKVTHGSFIECSKQDPCVGDMKLEYLKHIALRLEACVA
jgi:hypothetical protein